MPSEAAGSCKEGDAMGMISIIVPVYNCELCIPCVTFFAKFTVGVM